jgi:hypothetical protein
VDFKNKLGTVDAHNLNLSFKPDNTDSHNIILNFEHLADGSTNLNFGDDVSGVIEAVLDTDFSFEVTAVYADSGANTAVIDTVLDTEFSFDVVAVFSENTDVIGQIDAVLDTSFSFEIEAVFSENLCIIDAVLDTNFSFEVNALFDINHIVGVSYGFDMHYQKAITALSTTEIPWAKPILRVSNEALFYDQGLVISNQANIQFEQAGSLIRAIRSLHEQATGLSSDAYVIWEEGDKRFIHQRYSHEETIKLHHNRKTVWQEMIRRRKTFTYSHEMAQVFEHRFSFEWDKGLEIVTKSDLPWDKAKAIHYRKHPVLPWPKPETPKYEGSTDLNFICLCHDVDSHNVVLNFGADDCFPQGPQKKWWYILNNVSVTRLDNNEPITIIDGTYETGRDRWCWAYSLTLAPDQLHKLVSENDEPVVLKIMVNGFEHHMLVEGEPEQTRRFAQTLYRLNGRSRTALDSSTYASTRSFLQENERRAEQLCQAELDREFSDTLIDWQLLETTGWIVPTQSLTYTNLAPIDAIKLVVEAGGGFIYSQKASKTLSILPKYKKGYWDAMQLEDYDLLLNESMMLQHEIKPVDHEFDYNGITLLNSRNGNTAKVRIAGTSAETMLPNATNPMFTVVSMGGYGKTELCRENVKERHVFSQMPVTSEIGEMLPGKTVAFSDGWWGVIDNVKGAFNHKEVWETVGVERISRE